MVRASPRAVAAARKKRPAKATQPDPVEAVPPVPELVTLRQFAALIGVAPNAVSKAIAIGRLPPEVARRQPNGRFAIDHVAARRAWVENATQETALEDEEGEEAEDPLDEEVGGDVLRAGAEAIEETARRAAAEAGIREDVPIREARRLKTVYEAAIAKLKYRQASGELVPLLDAERRFASAGLKISTELRAIPATLLARGVEPDVVATVEREILRCLGKLAAR